jgi:hypothetical protein
MKKLLKTKTAPVEEPKKRSRREIVVSLLLPCSVRMTVQQDEGDIEWYVDTVSDISPGISGVRSVTENFTDDTFDEVNRLAPTGKVIQ